MEYNNYSDNNKIKVLIVEEDNIKYYVAIPQSKIDMFEVEKVTDHNKILNRVAIRKYNLVISANKFIEYNSNNNNDNNKIKVLIVEDDKITHDIRTMEPEISMFEVEKVTYHDKIVNQIEESTYDMMIFSHKE